MFSIRVCSGYIAIPASLSSRSSSRAVGRMAKVRFRFSLRARGTHYHHSLLERSHVICSTSSTYLRLKYREFFRVWKWMSFFLFFFALIAFEGGWLKMENVRRKRERDSISREIYEYNCSFLRWHFFNCIFFVPTRRVSTKYAAGGRSIRRRRCAIENIPFSWGRYIWVKKPTTRWRTI